MAVYGAYSCPMCNSHVPGLLRLITRPVVRCRRCNTAMNVTREAVAENWTRTLYVYGVLVCWGLLGAYVLLAPGPASGPLGPVSLVCGLLLCGWMPALVFALPFALVGSIVGNILGARFAAQTAPMAGPPRDRSPYVPQEHDWR
jgi:hypothetical protein